MKKFHNPMTAPRVDEDESESDDQGPMWDTSFGALPLTKGSDIENSESTGSTSPCSSNKEFSSLETRDFKIQFSNVNNTREIDCDYTDEQVNKLWFTKEEYDDFLEACDEDAEKHEEYEKETRVKKVRKEIRRKRRQRQKEEKRKSRIRGVEDFDESMNSLANFEDDDDSVEISDVSEDEESHTDHDENQEGWMCPLGLEAWTLDGYKAREEHRQKAIDSVLNEQYAAWDRGMLENMEMMATLYFAASAVSKHEAHKKARELEEDIQKQTLISTLEDYNKAVQTLKVLQKSLDCIKGKQKGKNVPKAQRRGSTGSIGVGRGAQRRGSTGSMGSLESESDRALSRTLDQPPQLPIKALSPPPSYPPKTSSSRKKKAKQRNGQKALPQKIYKSKAETNIIFMPPTPPVSKKPAVVYKPSKGGPPKGLEVGAPLTKSPKQPTKSPKVKKIVVTKVLDGPPKVGTSKSSETETAKKKKKKTKDPSASKKITSKGEKNRSKSPSSSERKKERRGSKSKSDECPETPKSPSKSKKGRRRSKSPCPGDEYLDTPKTPSRSRKGRRSKSPTTSTRSTSRSASGAGSERRRSLSSHTSKSPHASKSPGSKGKGTKDSKGSIAGKLLKKIGAGSKSPNSEVGYAPLTNQPNSPHGSVKKEHWWIQQQRQACQ